MNPNEYRIMHELEPHFWWYRGMRKIVSSVLHRMGPKPEPALHLDAGCGTGGNLKFLGRQYQSYGLEPAEPAMTLLARDGFTRVVHASVLAAPFPEDTFHLVTAFECIQNVDEDLAALRELHRVTRKGGCLLVREAALKSLTGEHDQADASVRRYGKAELEDKIRCAGFKIGFSSYANFLLLPPIFVLRTGRRLLASQVENAQARSDFRFSPSVLDPLFYACLSAEAVWLRRFSLPLGVSVLVAATKEDGS